MRLPTFQSSSSKTCCKASTERPWRSPQISSRQRCAARVAKVAMPRNNKNKEIHQPSLNVKKTRTWSGRTWKWDVVELNEYGVLWRFYESHLVQSNVPSSQNPSTKNRSHVKSVKRVCAMDTPIASSKNWTAAFLSLGGHKHLIRELEKPNLGVFPMVCVFWIWSFVNKDPA